MQCEIDVNGLPLSLWIACVARPDNRYMAAVIEEIPLAKDSLGVYRVGGTRVMLDLVVRAFNRGATAEVVVDSRKAATVDLYSPSTNSGAPQPIG